MRKLGIALLALSLNTSAVHAHKMNQKGEAISLESFIEDQVYDANIPLAQKIDNLPLSTEEKLRFSVILKPQSGKNWSPGHAITACFFQSTSAQFRQAFDAIALEWFENVSLTLRDRDASGEFNVCESGNFEVRIGNFPGQGSYSAVGKTRSAGARLPNGAFNDTLNIDYPGTTGPLFRFLVLHETGHMLGVEHEHQNGNSKCRFKDSAVYAHYTPLMPGNTDEERRRSVKTNILDRFYAGPGYYVTAFDPSSAMIYYFSADMYEDDVASQCQGGQPDRLSNQDLAGIEAVYARRVAGVGGDPLADLKSLTEVLQRSRLPDFTKADILAEALKRHPVAGAVVAPRP